ncbi:TIGR04222 domain-containing membrane protein [Dactylosporangium sp. NPDC050688]|uniref:TIGR04222 domain-containing membrane protein n=1 Tax=Dactylosporangium sp. NPDC050688 TaxID=3157217 RepID=UPI0033E8BFA1
MRTSIVAGPGDTWGIAGPDFLWLYAGLAALAIITALIWRRGHLRGPSLRSARDLTPTQAALLNGDRRLAVYSSLAALRAAGAVDTNARGTLRQAGRVPTGAGELDRAVHAAAGRRVPVRSVQTDAAVSGVLRRTEEQLTLAGWLMDEDRRRGVRIASFIVFAAAALGVARIVAGIANDRPVGFLILLVIPVVIIALLFWRVPRTTTNGRRLLAQMRARTAHLAPRQSPSWSTYGPEAAALSVGLYGAGAFFLADPEFAEAAELQRNVAMSSGGSSGGGSDGGWGSSDSGSSSSCGGGGSSCGGGGGGCGG